MLPLILLFLFGYGVSLDAKRVRIGVAVEATNEASQSLAAAFRASRFFAVTEARDRRELEPLLIAGNIRGIVVIPANFGEEAARNLASAQIQVQTDGSEPNTAKFVENYAQGVYANWAASRASNAAPAQAISLVPRFWFNPELRSRYFLVPGVHRHRHDAGRHAADRARRRPRMGARHDGGDDGDADLHARADPGQADPLFRRSVLRAMAMCTAIGVFLFGVPLRGSILALLRSPRRSSCPRSARGC